MKFLIEDLKGVNLDIHIISSNMIEIEGKDLEVRILLYDVDADKLKEVNLETPND
jgi:hypothetical protein